MNKGLQLFFILSVGCPLIRLKPYSWLNAQQSVLVFKRSCSTRNHTWASILEAIPAQCLLGSPSTMSVFLFKSRDYLRILLKETWVYSFLVIKGLSLTSLLIDIIYIYCNLTWLCSKSNECFQCSQGPFILAKAVGSTSLAGFVIFIVMSTFIFPLDVKITDPRNDFMAINRIIFISLKEKSIQFKKVFTDLV